MRRSAVPLVAAAIALSARASSAQQPAQPLPTLPPSPPPAALPPPPPPPSAPAASVPPPPPPPPPEVRYDATAAPAAVTTVPPPYAESPQYPDSGARTHDGFYLRMSTGLGAMGYGGTTPTGASTSLGGGALSASLAMGGTPSRGFVFGGALLLSGTGKNEWVEAPTGNRRDWSAAMIGIDAFVDWFPNEHRGWHLGGMLGLSGVGVQDRDANVSYAGGAINARGFGGYDFWVGSQWSLGVQGALDVVSRAALNDDQGHDTGFRMGALGFFLEFTALYH